jgi:hypothetical protein
MATGSELVAFFLSTEADFFASAPAVDVFDVAVIEADVFAFDSRAAAFF